MTTIVNRTQDAVDLPVSGRVRVPSLRALSMPVPADDNHAVDGSVVATGVVRGVRIAVPTDAFPGSHAWRPPSC